MITTATLTKLIPVVLIGLLLATPLFGKGSYPGTWSGIYPESASLDNATDAGAACYLCHTTEGNSTWNAYGSAIKTSMDGGNSLAEAIVAIEALNSDNDPPILPQLPNGWSNIGEITYDGQPGWTTGMQDYFDENGDVIGTIAPPAGLVTLDPSPTVDAEETTWGRIKALFQAQP